MKTLAVAFVLFAAPACTANRAASPIAAIDAGGDLATSPPVTGEAAPAPDLASVTFAPPSGCDYLDGASTTVVLSCAAEWTTVAQMWSTSPACPPWYSAGGQALESFPQVVESLDCKTECVYRFLHAALFLHCGTKGEITRFEDGGAGQTGPVGQCPPLVRVEASTGSGWYRSAEEFNLKNPC